MSRILWLAASLFAFAFLDAPAAQAQSTVECHSRHYQYGECWAGLTCH